jgi:hypothetical protein
MKLSWKEPTPIAVLIKPSEFSLTNLPNFYDGTLVYKYDSITEAKITLNFDEFEDSERWTFAIENLSKITIASVSISFSDEEEEDTQNFEWVVYIAVCIVTVVAVGWFILMIAKCRFRGLSRPSSPMNMNAIVPATGISTIELDTIYPEI